MLTATVTADGQHIHLRGRKWAETFHASQLPCKIAFYESLRDRRAGEFAETYAPTVKALLRAQKTYQILNKPKETT
ncbi:hypothetical protein [Roseinatronobacter sp. NSM]|uniref:hypothetical protein n=1 Tax=Roseinatronobacter sp. NSM TaxID=3457785 RepID=UPI004036F59B